MTDGVLANSPKAGRAILEMMKERKGIYETLLAMHEVGLLGKIFPDFEEIRCRVIRDFFHKYTVDEHSLIAIRNIEELPSSHRFSILLSELENPELLLISLLRSTNIMKAIETRYKGYRFRSRLEARWAVFFDELRVPYSYETEGWQLSSGYYLPDFYLKDGNLWVEIKPAKLTTEDAEKCRQLADGP